MLIQTECSIASRISAGVNKNGLKVEKAALRGSLLYLYNGKVNGTFPLYRKSSGREAHCGVRGRCRDATAAGASFASETLF